MVFISSKSINQDPINLHSFKYTLLQPNQYSIILYLVVSLVMHVRVKIRGVNPKYIVIGLIKGLIV